MPSLLLVSNPALQFMTYEALKRRIGKVFGSMPPPAMVFFLIGAIAKTVATALTYPIQLAQTKLRVIIKTLSDLLVHPFIKINSLTQGITKNT